MDEIERLRSQDRKLRRAIGCTCGRNEGRIQSAEDRAEIRRRRRLAEEDAMRARGEHVPTRDESMAAFAAAAGRFTQAVGGIRRLIEARSAASVPTPKD